MLAAAPGGTTQVVTGTSVATAWAAGQAASLRLAQPTWSTADVRAALIDSSVALGTSDSRPSVHEQGGGVVNAQAAAAVKLVHVDGRIEFGSVAPGARGEVKLAMRIPGSAVSDATMLPKLHLDDGGATHGIVPTLDGDLLVIDVPSGAATQVVGGWLVIEDSGIRIPWSATIRDNAATTSPISLSLDRVTMPARAGRFTYPSTLSVGIGGTPSAGTLGLAGVERFELQLYDATNKLRGRVGVLDHALPGVYTVGVAPRDAQGKPLKAGAYTLRARYVPATDADGAWRSAGSVTFTVTAPRRSAK
jgi:hypothetical protein